MTTLKEGDFPVFSWRDERISERTVIELANVSDQILAEPRPKTRKVAY
jgi:hypothetical protein